ncbi:3-oxoacyl-(acyl-carrier-protein) reductase [Sphingobium chlorophenolicum L-1]|uniref:3-oxoacyl-(Acyl-carrier-protein) reductase n=1 Tax=Sphingobium chlorophenolicum L-1 TaxID=690566 RepID=F6F3D3_SPHCR|nr:SDR family oxidoreductase [Sphingobium chlorophenolicum]AEG50945.1 3-oxoacyl-(acyl-carrier-protein) reductase [Sphingobium chlorophenolicum L-1]
MIDLEGKSAVVLGVGAGNIGLAIARRFRDLGADVVIAGRNGHAISRIGRELGTPAVCCDITDKEGLDALVSNAKDRYSKVDIAVNAVGMNLVAPFLEVTVEELNKVIGVQFAGTFLFLQAMLGAMTGGGSIIQVSSVTSRALLPDHAVYMASKAAGDVLVRSAAFDFGHRGIRVNSLSPGATLDAPMARGIMQDPLAREEVRKLIPLGRLGTIQDVADAAAWLACDACFITGENIQVNGGIALQALSPPPADPSQWGVM